MSTVGGVTCNFRKQVRGGFLHGSGDPLLVLWGSQLCFRPGVEITLGFGRSEDESGIFRLVVSMNGEGSAICCAESATITIHRELW